MLVIEISYTTEDGEQPEHYGYYESVDDAIACLETLRGLEKEGVD